MSSTQVLEQVQKLPFEEQFKIFERLRSKFDPDLTPKQIVELERRAEDALAHPGRGTPVEEVSAEIKKRLLAKK